MKRKKENKLITKTVFVIGGLCYFMFFSGLDLPMLLKGYAIIVPVQIFAVIYLMYQYWHKQKKIDNLK
jgi:hypothetical protein